MYAINTVGHRRQHTIRVTQPVKQYLEKNFPSPFVVTQDHLLGMWLINAMVKKTKQVKTLENDPSSLQYLTNNRLIYTWSFIAPVRYNDSFVLPRRQVLRFNVMIRKFIHMEILLEIETLRKEGNVFNIQTAINNFRDKYQIKDTELNDEQLRKMYLRFREKNQTVSSEFSHFSPAMLLG